MDPYDVRGLQAALREADGFIRSPEGSIAVLIAKHPCIVAKKPREIQAVYAMSITDACVGCRACIDDFECPALRFDDEANRAEIDRTAASAAGVYVCPAGAIQAMGSGLKISVFERKTMGFDFSYSVSTKRNFKDLPH